MAPATHQTGSDAVGIAVLAYRLSNRNKSSRELGNCECCGQCVSEVWLLTEMTACPSRRNPGSDSYRGEDTTFGHRECLTALTELDSVTALRIAELVMRVEV